MFVHVIVHLSRHHPAECVHLKVANKGKVAKVKACQELSQK